MDDTLARLQQWYARQSDGDWQHQYGVEVRTLDNPGWHVTIDLAETDLEGRSFEPLERGLEDDASTDWHSLSVKENKFEGAGDSSKLAFMLRTFLDWAEQPGRRIEGDVALQPLLSTIRLSRFRFVPACPPRGRSVHCIPSRDAVRATHCGDP